MASTRGFEETIEVLATPVLNTTITAVGTSFDAEFIEDLPTTRNFWDMITGNGARLLRF